MICPRTIIHQEKMVLIQEIKNGENEHIFSTYMRRVAFIITSNKHTLSLFLTSKDSLIQVIMSVINPYTAASTCMKIKGLFMTPADSLSQITIFQYMAIRVLCNQKCIFNPETTMSLLNTYVSQLFYVDSRLSFHQARRLQF